MRLARILAEFVRQSEQGNRTPILQQATLSFFEEEFDDPHRHGQRKHMFSPYHGNHGVTNLLNEIPAGLHHLSGHPIQSQGFVELENVNHFGDFIQSYDSHDLVVVSN